MENFKFLNFKNFNTFFIKESATKFTKVQDILYAKVKDEVVYYGDKDVILFKHPKNAGLIVFPNLETLQENRYVEEILFSFNNIINGYKPLCEKEEVKDCSITIKDGTKYLSCVNSKGKHELLDITGVTIKEQGHEFVFGVSSYARTGSLTDDIYPNMNEFYKWNEVEIKNGDEVDFELGYKKKFQFTKEQKEALDQLIEASKKLKDLNVGIVYDCSYCRTYAYRTDVFGKICYDGDPKGPNLDDYMDVLERIDIVDTDFNDDLRAFGFEK